MPSRIRTRATKSTKALKENIDSENRQLKGILKTKTVRKALTDKTNSLSDGNVQNDVSKTVVTKVFGKESKISTKKETAVIKKERPRRERRLPTRYVENHALINLANSKDGTDVQLTKSHKESQFAISPIKKISEITKNATPLIKKTQDKSVLINDNSPSPFKTPLKNVDTSLVTNRPRRICRLPSRFEDHSISPNKFIHLQPCHASTPILPSKIAKTKAVNVENQEKNKKASQKVPENINNKPTGKVVQTTVAKPTKKIVDTLRSGKKVITQKKLDENLKEKLSPDTNNNPKTTRSVRNKGLIVKKTSPIVSPKADKRLLDKKKSFRVFEDKQNNNNVDVYEFTFDPNDEPVPQKKKRKRVVKKKPAQPKTVAYKNTYDKNVAKALDVLKTVVAKKTQHVQVNTKPAQNENIINVTEQRNSKPSSLSRDKQVLERVTKKPNDVPKVSENNPLNPSTSVPVNSSVIALSPVYEDNIDFDLPDQSSKPCALSSDKQVSENATKKLNDIARVNENNEPLKPSINSFVIALSPVYEDNIDFDLPDHNDINYSPVNSPNYPKTSNLKPTNTQDIIHKAPLNLQDDMSFFDDQPVASSSMNASAKHPLATPWRVEFGSLPIKWQVDSYVKSNMTPAVESSFISSEDNVRKTHVYTNILPEVHDALPHIVENYQQSLKQPTIISFIKEVAEKQALKKLHKSPRKVNSIFEDITNTNFDVEKSPKKHGKKDVSNNDNSSSKNSSSTSNNNLSNNRENSKENRKRKSDEAINTTPAKPPRRENNKDCTYFGFDESENQDENVSPVKNKNIDNCKIRALRPRSRAVLQEINGQRGPSRAIIPVAAYSKIVSGSDAVNRVYEGLKSAADAPLFTEKDVNNAERTNHGECQSQVEANDDESQSVHLFEDIDIVQHLKHHQKSYGKAKKVTFRHTSLSDSESNSNNVAEKEGSSEEDDTFQIPTFKEKKPIKKKSAKKKMMSKKEKKEADAWAAGFNSMCEDVEEFTLLVE